MNSVGMDLRLGFCVFSKHRPSGPMLSISRNVCPSVRLYVCPSVCVCVCSLLRYRLPVFLPPLPIFLEIRNPWGKSNGKKWSQIRTFLFENFLKSPRKKKFFSLLFSVFFVFRSFLTVFLPPLPDVRCPIFLEIRNSWGKVIERSGLRYEHFCLKIV